MAASLSIFTGQPNALLKLNLIQPAPRLWGSRRGCPLMIGPGYPNATRSYFQSLTHALTSRTILPAVIVGPDGILRGSFCPVASSLMLVPPASMTRTFGVFAARTLFIAVAPMAPRGYGFFSSIGKGNPEGPEKVRIGILRPRFRSGAEESQRQIVHSLNGWMPFTNKRTPKGSYPANLIIRTGITHWGSTARRRTRCPAAIMVYLPQVRLAHAESLSREASPSLVIATRAAPPWLIPLAVSSPQDSRNSALRLAKRFLRSAATSRFCESAQRRVKK